MRMRMSTIDVGMRLGDAIDPFHLANGFEAVIGYECQERSNHPFSHSYDAYKYMQGVTKQVSGWGGSLQCRRGILVLCLVILWMSLFGETFHAYPRLIRWTFPQFIEREIELVTMAHSCLSGQHMQDSDGGRKHRTCVRMQWWCCGCGTKRFSCL
jgi:hypothetical protein